MRQVLMFAMAVMVTSPCVAEAQRQGDLLSLRSTLTAYREGTGLRIRTDDGALYGTSSYRVVGPALVVSDTVLPAMESVTHVWRRHHHAATGAAIGGIVGGFGLGILSAAAVSGMCETSGCGGDAVAALGAGAVVGGLGGMLVGAIVGSFVPGWILVWQRDAR